MFIKILIIYTHYLFMEYTIRQVNKSDYLKGHLDLYKHLTHIDPNQITKFDYETFIDNLNNNHSIFVICDNDKIISTFTLFIEQKLLRNLGRVGHVEDVVVDPSYSNKGLGKKMMNFAMNYCKNNGCYKIILNCSDNNVGFYEKCGFIKKENEMVHYF